jgi:phage regulator Rha-like protein
MTYLKNTPIVREFKKALVRAFYELKNADVAKLRGDVNLAFEMIEELKSKPQFMPKRIYGAKLSEDEKEQIRRLRAQNTPTGAIACEIGCSSDSVNGVLHGRKSMQKSFVQKIFGGLK